MKLLRNTVFAVVCFGSTAVLGSDLAAGDSSLGLPSSALMLTSAEAGVIRGRATEKVAVAKADLHRCENIVGRSCSAERSLYYVRKANLAILKLLGSSTSAIQRSY